ncbi:MAG: hypothetical protein L6R39_005932 [Caloplaca ligustica]|nr:MAG: hypothetical protein L6R39_005932 [Caloplaca ligustica]
MRVTVETIRSTGIICHTPSSLYGQNRCRTRWIHLPSFKDISDFRALEAKWNALWAIKDKKLIERKTPTKHFRPLAPLPFSLLGIHPPKKRAYRRVRGSHVRSNGVFDKLLDFATPKESDQFVRICEEHRHLQVSIKDHGTDLVRTSVIFRSQPFGCDEKGIVQIRAWFELIWEAISVAHSFYVCTQANETESPAVPDALYEPNIDTWVDHLVDSVECLVHIPPHEPDILASDLDEDGDRVWFAAQDALRSFTQPVSASTSAQKIESQLVTLTKEIINYDNAHRVDNNTIYHAARILIRLTAPFAPCFAEECWVVLHYGPSASSHQQPNTALVDGNVDDEESRRLPSLEEIEMDLVKEEDYLHLPKRGYPETLPSVFELPFPRKAPTEAIHQLGNRVSGSRKWSPKEG